jgi:adenylate cyclase
MLQKILVVDNETVVCEACHIALGHLGYDIVCVKEDEAVARAQQDSFDLAVINTILFEMTGIALFKTLRQANPALVGILVTENTSLDLVSDVLHNGFSRVCRKPLDGRQLVEAVRETMKNAALQEDATRRKILLPLYNLGQRFIAAESEQAVFEELADAVSQQVHVPAVSVMIFDENTHCLKVVASRGLAARYMENVRIKPGEQIAGRVFQAQQSIILNKVNQQLSPYLDLMNRPEISAAMSFPIVSKGRVLGVVNVSETKEGMFFREADIEMLSIIVDQAMMAVENIRTSREREENSRIRAMLEQYVSREVSNMLIESKQDLLDVGRVEPLTVLFADIRKFTLLVQYLQPSQLRVFLNSFFDMFGSIVFSHQGMLDKFMGDAALVIFGAPVKIDNPNAAAVSAAHNIMLGFEKLRIAWQKKNTIFAKVGLGIGISRGPMFLGNVGSSQRLDYTVIGPDVNIAQRLASKTGYGQILITDRVQATLTDTFPVTMQGSMLLRGMESEVTVYSLSVADLESVTK